MKNLQQGENIELALAGITGKNILAGISWIRRFDSEIDIDVSAFLLNDDGVVISDEGFIFYNQLENSEKSIFLDTEPKNGIDVQLFLISIDKIPADICKIIFVVTIDKAFDRGQNFNDLDDLMIRIFEPDAFNEKTIMFKLEQFNKETSIVLGELYSNQSIWKFRALGQGFESGLAALAQLYGVDLSNDDTPSGIEQKYPNFENESRFIDQAMIENETRIYKQIKKIVPQIKNAAEQRLNESNTRILLDRFFTDILGYKIEEMKAEVKIQGRRADYVLAVGDKDILIVEVKKAGMQLKEDQIFQATSYAAYSGMKYVLLTNLCEFILFKVNTDGIVNFEVIFSIDLLSDFDIKDIKNLALISRYGMTKPELLEILYEQSVATGVENIARLLLEGEVLDVIKNMIKRENNCEVTNEQIQESIELFINTTLSVYS